MGSGYLRLAQVMIGNWSGFKFTFSMRPLCSLCLGGDDFLGLFLPPRHGEHKGCTELAKTNIPAVSASGKRHAGNLFAQT